MIFLLTFALEVGVYGPSNRCCSIFFKASDFATYSHSTSRHRRTGEPHALDSAPLSLQLRSQPYTLCRLPGAVKTLDDYERAPNALRHCSRQSIPIIYQSLAHSGLRTRIKRGPSPGYFEMTSSQTHHRQKLRLDGRAPYQTQKQPMQRSAIPRWLRPFQSPYLRPGRRRLFSTKPDAANPHDARSRFSRISARRTSPLAPHYLRKPRTR